MHLKISYILILQFLCFSVYSQQQDYIDSLQQKLVNADGNQKIRIYNGLSWATKFSSPALAFEYAEKAYHLSKELGNETAQAISLNRMGAANLKLGELNTSLMHMLEAIKISNNNQKIIATSKRQIGEVYEAQGNLPEAMKNYYIALSIVDSIGKPIEIARSALRVAGLYIKLEKFQISDRYLDYAIDVYKEEKYLRGLHLAYLLKGDYYFKQGIQDSSIIYYNKALSSLENLKDRYGYATTIAKIARVMEAQGNFDDAITDYYRALDTFKIINDKKEVTHTYVALAQAYANSKNAKKGIYYGEIALSESKKLGLSNEEKGAYYVLYSIYKEINNQSKAISYLESYLNLMDSLHYSEESWRVEQMQNSYELEIQVKENELSKAIITNQALTIKNNSLIRNFLIIIAALVFALATIIGYTLKKVKRANQQLILANEEKNEAISLISHDLKSPFNKIKGLAHILELQLENIDAETADLLSKINIITHDGLVLVQNLVDIKALKSGSYIIKNTSFEINDFFNNRVQGFEQFALLKKIKIKFEPLETNRQVYSDVNSISRIFDNILSNAIKYSPEGEIVLIECSIVENSFSFSISDNGKGIDQKDIATLFEKYKTGLASPTGTELSNGLGLAIASSLINKLRGTIKCISQLGNGATFIVSLPINQSSI